MSADSSPTASAPGKTRRTPPRIWLYRGLAAIGIPALILMGLEGGLRIAGFGQTVRFMIPDTVPGYLRTNPNFVSSFMPSSFDLRPLNFRVAKLKEPDTVRIVVLGESAAQGIPVPSFGFAAQLRAQLRARYPGREFEVINTGIVAINSHVVYQIAREMAGLKPDLFVVYMGNNEVVGPYGPGCAYLSEMPPLWVIRLSVFVRSTRTGQLAAAIVGRLATRGPAPAEWGGMAMFANSAVAGDDPRLETVYRNFEANLRDIVAVAKRAGAATILCTVVSNLKDCAPLLSVHAAGISEKERATWGRAFERGRIEWLLDKEDPARADLNEALRLDPHYADTSFMLGSLDWEARDTEAARGHFIDAAHWDALRFRPDPRINDIIRKIAKEYPVDTHLVDAALQMGSDPASPGPPSGRELLFEHVHFDWDGNFRLARSLAAAAEGALFGGGKSALPWLDAKACAEALAYTPYGRLGVLEKITTIIQNPPFTNQVTYPEDEARFARDVALAKRDQADPGYRDQALKIARAASAADPKSADLAKIMESIDDDAGDIAGALEESRRSIELEPGNYALPTDEAIKLSRLARFDEAEKLLLATAASCDSRDRAAMAPAFADFYTRTRRPLDGVRFLDGEISRRPKDESLKLLRGRLYKLAGDGASAEAEFRAILAGNPGSQPALEALVRLLGEAGRPGAAETESLAAQPHQLGNFANDLRSALIYEARSDENHSVQCLISAEHCGHVTAAVELRVAQELFKLQRYDEALAHLAQARRISFYEGDSSATDSIGRAAEHLWTQLH